MFKKLVILYFYFKTKYFTRKQNFKVRQDKKIKKIIKSIVKKSKFYKSKFAGYDLDEYKSLPTIQKDEFMLNFDTLNTVGIKKDKALNLALKAEKDRNFIPKIDGITVGLSSGTSGNKGIFLASDFERYKWAGAVLAKVLPGSIFSRHKIAFFLRANSNLYESIGSKNITFKYFDLLTPLHENLNLLSNFSPTLLVAPPSMLRLIAKNLSTLDIKPQKIVSVAEVLEQIDRDFLQTAFGMPIHEVYQATEGFIATTCEYGNLHINEDILLVEKESLSEDRFTPIITDFSRTTQPVIRYRLNDILIQDDSPCPCGSEFMRIKRIIGRCDDMFYLRSLDDGSLKAVFADFISRAIIYASEHIKEYKVVQISPDKLEVFIDKDDEFQAVISSLNSLFVKLGCQAPQISKIPKPDTKSITKFKRIESRFKP